MVESLAGQSERCGGRIVKMWSDLQGDLWGKSERTQAWWSTQRQEEPFQALGDPLSDIRNYNAWFDGMEGYGVWWKEKEL